MAGDVQACKSPAKHNSTISAAGLIGFGSVASLRMQVSRMTFKIRLGAAQCECAALLLDKRHGLRIAHRFAGVGAMRPREFRREPETHELATDNCFRLHGLKLTWLCRSDKPFALFILASTAGTGSHRGCFPGRATSCKAG